MAEQSCPLLSQALENVKTIKIQSEKTLNGYQEAVVLAKNAANKHFEDPMLISWYDRDRDFESPPNTTEQADGSKKTGYIVYGLNHGAKLKIDVENGRFVFFFAPMEW